MHAVGRDELGDARGRPIQTNGLSPLEIASHVIVGGDDEPVLGPPVRDGSAIDALERSLLTALTRPPCVVGFSGGRDSSALLAVATRVARREGLPDPIPSTLRFTTALASHEDDWQELVLGHLGLTERSSHELDDELDLVGPVAARMMLRDGLPYPYNLHLLLPLIEEAHGGSFITGLGGDQVLDGAGAVLDVLARRTRPVRRDLLRIGAALAPRPVRRRVFRSRVGLTFPWLRPAANARLTEAWLEQFIRRPLRWDSLMRQLSRARFMRMTVRRIAAVGERSATAVHHPFADDAFVAALTREAGPTGFASRTAAFESLFGDVLPGNLIGRDTKASFNEVLWNRHTRSFVSGMDEQALERLLETLGLDAIVDPRALADHWAGDDPLANSFLLLQACWLATRRSAASCAVELADRGRQPRQQPQRPPGVGGDKTAEPPAGQRRPPPHE